MQSFATSSKKIMNNNLMNTNEVAKYLNKSPETIRRWIRSNKIKGYKVGGTWYIRQNELEAFIVAGAL